MTRNAFFTAISAVALGAVMAPSPAHAQQPSALTLTLTQPFQSATPASTLADPLAYYGTLTNTGTQPIFLYNAAFTSGIPGVTLDATPFEFNAPTELYAAGDPTGPDSFSGELFTAAFAPDEPAGIYSGQFDVLAGTTLNPAPGPIATVVDNTAATATFSATAIPEPSDLALLLCGSILIGGLKVMRRRA